MRWHVKQEGEIFFYVYVNELTLSDTSYMLRTLDESVVLKIVQKCQKYNIYKIDLRVDILFRYEFHIFQMHNLVKLEPYQNLTLHRIFCT